MNSFKRGFAEVDSLHGLWRRFEEALPDLVSFSDSAATTRTRVADVFLTFGADPDAVIETQCLKLLEILDLGIKPSLADGCEVTALEKVQLFAEIQEQNLKSTERDIWERRYEVAELAEFVKFGSCIRGLLEKAYEASRLAV